MNNDALKQAVILCGGLGTRLKPLTDNLPKPMVLVNGKPYLYYLLQQLADQGITEFLLLTGYLGDQISDYFGDGRLWNWNISYSAGPTEWDTGRRIWEARKLFDPQFLLLYSDNFAQLRLSKLIDLRETLNCPITLILAPKDKGNIKVSENGSIEAYDKNRDGEGFSYVEVGYMIVDRDPVLTSFGSCEGFPDFNFSLLLQKFAMEGKIAGLIVRDPYHSISDQARLAKMCAYQSPKKIILIDRDGTINQKAPRGEYVTSVDMFKFIPETYQAMKQLASEGFRFIIITNQAGIAREKLTLLDLENIHDYMKATFAEDNIDIMEIYCSPHHWDENSFMRKPQPGMFFSASAEFDIRLDKTIYIGDDIRDCQAAYNAGCRSIFIGSEDELSNLKEKEMPLGVFPTMLESLNLIREFYTNNKI